MLTMTNLDLMVQNDCTDEYVEFRDTPMVTINSSYKYVEFRDTPMITINPSYN